MERRVIDQVTGCWLFGDFKEYGQISINNRTQLVHVIIATIFLNYKKESGLKVLHKCDVKPCFNPEHLFIGTQSDNMVDALKKGRMPVGENHASSKLNAEQITEIRKELNRNPTSWIFKKVLAKRHGVHPTTIHDIQHGKSWKQLDSAIALAKETEK